MNFFTNLFKSFDFFKFKQYNKNLSNLKTLFIGANEFKNNVNEEEKYDLNSIEEIGLSKGVFNNNTIKLVSNFLFKNLVIIYLSFNIVDSLFFIEKLELPSIKQFYMHTTSITEFYPLIKYKTLEKIILKNNKISNINNLITFVDNLPNLKEFDLRENNIDLNDIKNKEIIKKVKEKINLINY